MRYATVLMIVGIAVASLGCGSDPGTCGVDQPLQVPTAEFELRNMGEFHRQLLQGVAADATVRVDRENDRVELSYRLETGEQVVEVYRIASTSLERSEPTSDPIRLE